MKFTLTLIDWQARAPGLSDADEWQAWSRRSDAIDPAAPLAKLTDLPMMTARRLNSGSRLAVDLGLMMLRKHRIDAVVYSSRHGELERNFRILRARQNSLFPHRFCHVGTQLGGRQSHYRRASACCLFVGFRRYGYLPAELVRRAEPAACGLLPRIAGGFRRSAA